MTSAPGVWAAHSRRPRRRVAVLGAVAALIAAGFVGVHSPQAGASDRVVLNASTFTASNGVVFTATNHLVQDSPAILKAKRDLIVSARNGTNPLAQKIVTAAGRIRHEYLVVWAGDENASDHASADLTQLNPSVDPSFNDPKATEKKLRDNALGPDFLAIIDATAGSPTQGRVVNTVTVSPVSSNEPHHMQYLWHKGDAIYAGGLYSDITYVFNVKALPKVELTGVNLPLDTPCGSIPDAYWTLRDGTAYGTYMGGADVPGPCKYTNGAVRLSNGFGGSPGSIVHLDEAGKTLSEVPASSERHEGVCSNYPPLPKPTCANPHGIQVREDLNRMVTSDFVEPRNIVLDPIREPDPYLLRDTVRIFDITKRDDAQLVSVTAMPDGPRIETSAAWEEPRGTMELGITNQHQHRGVFISAMCGGAIYYTPDITAVDAVWREVWDVTAYSGFHYPGTSRGDGCSGSSWIQVSPDDDFLFNAVIGRGPGSTSLTGADVTKQVFVLDIRKLLKAGNATTCNIRTVTEATHGGAQADCPTLADSFHVVDNTSGGPHWGAMDNFQIGPDGFYHETEHLSRIAFNDYFVARTNVDGNHQLCILDVSRQGKLSLDQNFVDQRTGQPCVQFNRLSWPHGDFGNALPHSEVFAVADEDVR
ncbi:MAG TPA: hypothetical protein VE081_07725 [Sporichthyaceae bacterium]|nr:hypothetical protein [Sporichthyaceae bacterium]